MTEKEAVYTLSKHAMLFHIAETNQQIPDASSGAVQEIYSALKFFQPNYPIDWCCGSCIFRMIETADSIRKEKLKFYTF